MPSDYPYMDTNPETQIHCYCGQTHELGGFDCDGYFIGYIDDGTCWESVRERDVSITTGRFEEAWNRWNCCGGVLGAEPSPEDFARIYCREIDSIEEAIRECQNRIDPDDILNREVSARIAARAMWN